MRVAQLFIPLFLPKTFRTFAGFVTGAATGDVAATGAAGTGAGVAEAIGAAGGVGTEAVDGTLAVVTVVESEFMMFL